VTPHVGRRVALVLPGWRVHVDVQPVKEGPTEKPQVRRLEDEWTEGEMGADRMQRREFV
jgi:hypothetical protein